MNVPKPGDRVRLTLEGVVSRSVKHTYKSTEVVVNRVDEPARHLASVWLDEDAVQVEVLKPEVVTFGPGQTVRHKMDGTVYTIGGGGYFSHGKARWENFPYTFTSDLYELVTFTAVES